MKRYNKMEQHKENHKQKRRLSKSFYTKVYLVLGLALILFTLYNITQTASFSKLFDQRLAEAKEAAKPAKIQLITILDSKCKDCFDILPVVNSIKKANINITQEENLGLNSDKAMKLIDKYKVEKVPTVLLFGEIDKINIKDLEKRDDALVFTQVNPPYTYTKSKQIIGMVSTILLEDSSCDKCSNLDYVLDGLKKLGIKMSQEDVVDRDSKKGKELISKYGIRTVPTLIFSKDLGAYGSEIIDGWGQIGYVGDDGSYITSIKNPPYLDLAINEVLGLVSMTVLVDDSCEDCYEPDDFHKPILQRMGVVLEEEKRVDVSSALGMYLIKKYDIEKVPTIILFGDMDEYQTLVRAWRDVGSVEPDGAYVFRKVEVAKKTYKDLSKDEIVR
jgi:thioredoxin-related protein